MCKATASFAAGVAASFSTVVPPGRSREGLQIKRLVTSPALISFGITVGAPTTSVSHFRVDIRSRRNRDTCQLDSKGEAFDDDRNVGLASDYLTHIDEVQLRKAHLVDARNARRQHPPD